MLAPSLYLPVAFQPVSILNSVFLFDFFFPSGFKATSWLSDQMVQSVVHPPPFFLPAHTSPSSPCSKDGSRELVPRTCGELWRSTPTHINLLNDPGPKRINTHFQGAAWSLNVEEDSCWSFIPPPNPPFVSFTSQWKRKVSLSFFSFSSFPATHWSNFYYRCHEFSEILSFF